MTRAQRRAVRRQVQFMFQDPYSSLDPRMKVGAILREPLQIQRVGHRAGQRRRVGELLDAVGLPSSASTATRTSSAADNASASDWPARWPSVRA